MPARHAIDFSTDIAGLLRGEQNVSRRKLGGLARTFHRDIRPERYELLRRLSAARLQWGPDGARRDAVDSDASGNQLLG